MIELPKAGMVMVLVPVLSSKVLDHLISTVAPMSEKNISPLHKCLETSKVVGACGSMFEMRRNEKKANVYKEVMRQNQGNFNNFFPQLISYDNILYRSKLSINLERLNVHLHSFVFKHRSRKAI